MRTFINTATIVRASDETIAAPAPVAVAPAFNSADTSKSNVAESKPAKRTPKLTGKAVAPKADKPAKPVVVAPVETAKPVAPMHSYTAAYAGASQPLRAHNKKLSPIVLDRVPNSYTDRDGALLKALHTANGTKQFQRLNIDAGALSRLIGHGYVSHASGPLDQRDAKFAITAKAVRERFAKA